MVTGWGGKKVLNTQGLLMLEARTVCLSPSRELILIFAVKC